MSSLSSEGLSGETEEAALFLPVMRQVFAQKISVNVAGNPLQTAAPCPDKR
jgi:hypothetical protein